MVSRGVERQGGGGKEGETNRDGRERSRGEGKKVSQEGEVSETDRRVNKSGKEGRHAGGTNRVRQRATEAGGSQVR